MASEVERGERREREKHLQHTKYCLLLCSLRARQWINCVTRERKKEREGDKREKIRIWNWRGDQKATGMPSSCQWRN
jgi:hypothetical protein